MEELFALLRLFAGVTCDPSREKTKEEEAFEAAFRKDTIALYQSVLDPGASWTTLIRYKYSILHISTLLRYIQLSLNGHLELAPDLLAPCRDCLLGRCWTPGRLDNRLSWGIPPVHVSLILI